MIGWALVVDAHHESVREASDFSDLVFVFGVEFHPVANGEQGTGANGPLGCLLCFHGLDCGACGSVLSLAMTIIHDLPAFVVVSSVSPCLAA